MDLSCPAEFRTVEVLRDSGGRAQAYLTFMNLSARELTELHAMVTMLDPQEVSMGIRPLRYKNLAAGAHAPFTICLVMDDLPFFEQARVTIQRVLFKDGSVWEWDEEALIDCTPKLLAPGPQRVALVAVAGADAVCWPERRRDAWVCVCGRFNPHDRADCLRCGRDREQTFADYQMEPVLAEYRERQRREVARERRAHEDAAAQEKKRQTRRQHDFARRLGLVIRRRRLWWLAAAGVLTGLGILWGVATLALQNTAARQAMQNGTTVVLSTPAPKAPTVLAEPTAAPAPAGEAAAG